jgi:hypothetical protein
MGSSLTSPPTVYSVFLLETLQTALSGADLYYWFVSGYGNVDHLTSPYASSFDVPIMGSVVSLSVQFFFVYRIWVLASGKKGSWLLCILICLVILSLVWVLGLSNFFIVLYCRRNSGLRWWRLREPPRFTKQEAWLKCSRRMSTRNLPTDEHWKSLQW